MNERLVAPALPRGRQARHLTPSADLYFGSGRVPQDIGASWGMPQPVGVGLVALGNFLRADGSHSDLSLKTERGWRTIFRQNKVETKNSVTTLADRAKPN